MTLAEINGVQPNFRIERDERQRVVNECRKWVGTAFHHRARKMVLRDASGRIIDRGGVDCAQSVYAIYRAAVPHLVPEMAILDAEYAFQWNLSKATAEPEQYLNTVLAHSKEIKRDQTKPGDFVMFRIGLAYAHGAVIMPPGWPHIAHADSFGGSFCVGSANEGQLKSRKTRFFTIW